MSAEEQIKQGKKLAELANILDNLGISKEDFYFHAWGKLRLQSDANRAVVKSFQGKDDLYNECLDLLSIDPINFAYKHLSAIACYGRENDFLDTVGMTISFTQGPDSVRKYIDNTNMPLARFYGRRALVKGEFGQLTASLIDTDNILPILQRPITVPALDKI